VNHFHYRGGALWAEEVPLVQIAREVGTPTYVYVRATLERHYRVMTAAFAEQAHLLCYSVKASSNLALLSLFARLGAGFDIVSGGELLRVARATGGHAGKVVFSGVGKTEDEMAAALKLGIRLFNVESREELEALDRVGRRLKRRAPFAIRVNPGVDARTHHHIATGLRTSKFGVSFAEARRLYALSRRMKGVLAKGLDCHIGSQLTDAKPLAAALGKVSALYRELSGAGFELQYLDVGGGLGITYRDEKPPSPDDYARVASAAARGTGATLILEPGRVLVGNAGALLTRVLYRKDTPASTFAIIDAGMNDLIRPALYGAHHEIQPVVPRAGRRVEIDVVGPVCESSDVMARARRLPPPRRGDLYAVMSAGAYGMSMASNYNSRARPAEVLVDGARFRVIRRREALEDLWRGESA
jgi:diaminopimelate decarboxylase